MTYKEYEELHDNTISSLTSREKEVIISALTLYIKMAEEFLSYKEVIELDIILNKIKGKIYTELGLGDSNENH